MHHKRFLALLVISLSLHSVTIAGRKEPTAAQKPGPSPEQDEAQASRTPGQELPAPHDEVTVTATRTATELKKVGQSVTVITAEEMEARGARTVAQVLETVPGFNVTRAGSFGAVTTAFVRGGESDFNLVMIDGVKVNQPGGTYDFAGLSTANIERIEIVRGPSSVLYGANAASAVINVVTRRGADRPSGNVRFEGGSYGSLGVNGHMNGGLSSLKYSFGGLLDHTDGLYDLNSGYRNTDLSGRASWHLKESTELTGMVRYSDSRLDIPTGFTGAVIDPNDYRRDETTVYSMALMTRPSTRFATKVQYGYDRGNFRTYTLKDDTEDFFDSVFEAAHNRHQIDWQNEVRLNGSNLVTAGVSMEREETEVDDLNRRSLGFYIQDQISWNDRFFLTAGIRYDNNNRFRSFGTGSLAAGLLLTENLRIRGSVGNGFRAPAFYEIYGFPDFGIQGNASLRPEKNTAFDLGFDYTAPDQRVAVSGTAFFNRYGDLIEFTFLSDPGSPNYFNVEAAESAGVELEASTALPGGILAGGQYTFTRTEVTDAGSIPGDSFQEGQALLRRPRHLAGVFAEFEWKRNVFRFDLRFKGKRDDIEYFPDFSSTRVVLPSYWKADFAAKVPILGLQESRGQLSLVVRAENLFDRSYTEVAGFQSVGRAIFGGIQLGF